MKLWLLGTSTLCWRFSLTHNWTWWSAVCLFNQITIHAFFYMHHCMSLWAINRGTSKPSTAWNSDNKQLWLWSIKLNYDIVSTELNVFLFKFLDIAELLALCLHQKAWFLKIHVVIDVKISQFVVPTGSVSIELVFVEFFWILIHVIWKCVCLLFIADKICAATECTPAVWCRDSCGSTLARPGTCWLTAMPPLIIYVDSARALSTSRQTSVKLLLVLSPSQKTSSTLIRYSDSGVYDYLHSWKSW